MKTDGILFDLDGTLWDSCRVVSESWRRTLRTQYGVEDGPDPDAVRGIMGMTAQEIAAALFSGFGVRAEEVCRACIRGENDYLGEHGGTLYPGTAEMLRALSARAPLFIVSNCLDGYIQCFFQSSGLGECFTDFLSEGATGLPKAENIALLIARYGLEHPVYVGDTSSDENSARLSGCAFVHAAYGFGTADAPDASVNAPMELVALLGGEGEKHG